MNSCAHRNREAGFSLIELLIMVSIMVIMTTVAIYAMIPHQKAYKIDDEAQLILGFMRQASQRALTQRQPQRMEIDLTDNTIKLIDENSAASGDDVTVSTKTLESTYYVRLSTAPVTVASKLTGTSKPTNVSQPAAPAQPNFSPALFITNTSSHSVWSARYMSDGRVVDSSGNVISATLFLWAPMASNNLDQAQVGKVRAISFFGATGATKLWAYTGSGTTFEAK